MDDLRKMKKLQITFPKLTEANQHYVLGLAEGLKRAQGGRPEKPKTVKQESGKKSK